MTPLYVLIVASVAVLAGAQTTSAPPRFVLDNEGLRNRELILHRMEQLQCRQETPYTCGVAVIRTVLEYFNVPCRADLGIFWENAIAARGNTNCIQGTTIDNVVTALNDYIIQYVSYERQRSYSLTEIIRLGDNAWNVGRWIYNSLASDAPVILLYSYGGGQGEEAVCHFVIVYGVSATGNDVTFHVHDPEYRITRYSGREFLALMQNYGYIVHHSVAYVLPEEPSRGPRPSTSGNTMYSVDLPDPWCDTYHPHSLFLTYPDSSDSDRKKRSTNSTQCPEIVNVIYDLHDNIFALKEFEMKIAKVTLDMSTVNVIMWAYQKYPRDKFKLYLTKLFSKLNLYDLDGLMHKSHFEEMSTVTYNDFLVFNENRLELLAKGKKKLVFGVHFTYDKTVWRPEWNA